MFSNYLTACNTNIGLIGPRLVHLPPKLSFIPQSFPSTTKLSFIPQSFPSSSKPFLHPPNLSFIPQTSPSSTKPFLHSPNLSFIPQTFPSPPKPLLHPQTLCFMLLSRNLSLSRDFVLVNHEFVSSLSHLYLLFNIRSL